MTVHDGVFVSVIAVCSSHRLALLIITLAFCCYFCAVIVMISLVAYRVLYWIVLVTVTEVNFHISVSVRRARAAELVVAALISSLYFICVIDYHVFTSVQHLLIILITSMIILITTVKINLHQSW